MVVRITPSILNANLANLASEVGRIPSADGLHIDVMDGHFVPNLVMGAPFVESLRPATNLMFDVHLMIENPDRWARQYVEAGAQSVTFHLEAATAPIKLARELRSMGARASVALRPATPVEQLADILTEFDQILLMTVEPGFGGQKFLDPVLAKIRKARKLIDATHKDIWLQIDGGVSADTIERAAEAGADTFVAGSAVYRSDNPDHVVASLRNRALAAQVCAH
ncbi:ribulose-phosphate 3-epimerase [Cutibacterium acnes]|uniref:ribulose-phosphate 3-epimerase n=1 Tax=Cutibacterium acnes TaxID=1747 RepID=UPI0007E51E89|nr:ribulose-phosphate 3-epimerase [Cutibacterium acnes]OAX91203.1 ribulose-phosphate 3-epimerase [Cutibacterium acnes]